MVITMGIKEGRNNFSKLLAYARQGKTVIITDSGRPAYQIVAIEPENADIQDTLNDYMLKGWIEGTGNGIIPPVLELHEHDGMAQRILLEDREQ